MFRRILAIVIKEFRHIQRDPRSLAVMFLIPVIQLILLGYAATTDVKHLAIGVVDYDRSPESRDLIRAYQASNYFTIDMYLPDTDALRFEVDRGRLRGGLIIPAGYAHDLAKTGRATVGFVVDGSDPSIAQTAFSAAQAVGQAKSVEIIQERLHIDPDQQPGIDVRPRVWYNPEMRSQNFMVPGLIGTVLTLMTMMMTALAIVREREWGTIEQLVVTPIRPIELVIGKVTPYIVVAFWDLLEILVVGVFWFHVPIRGSVPLLLELSAIYVLSSLALGLLISTVAQTQQEAMFLTYFLFLPFIFLSGFFFPIDAMPKALQIVSMFVPLKYVLIIVRGVILKGVGLPELHGSVLAISAFAVVLLLVAASRFRKQGLG